MKKIQILTYNEKLEEIYKSDKDKIEYSVNSLSNPIALDEFDINIIDLTCKEIWRSKSLPFDEINCIDDIKHYMKIINNNHYSKILILFPQNIDCLYNNYSGLYHNTISLKNILNKLYEIIRNNINNFQFTLDFETSITTINNVKFTADFSFEGCDKKICVLKSDKSNKVNTIKVEDNMYYTTLDLIESSIKLEDFLNKVNILSEEEKHVPDWINNVFFLDDETIYKEIDSIDSKIKLLTDDKEKFIKKRNENNKVKSILYKTGVDLQLEVISILNEIFEYKDDEFVDTMEEDYKIKLKDVTFLFETKGLKGNIKGSHVSAAKNHVEIYIEDNDCEETGERVKGIFIVGTEIEKEPSERQELPDRQVKPAKNTDLLIIRVEKLLSLYEEFKRNNINKEEIKKQFMDNIGELK